MFSCCDLTAELSLQETSCESNIPYPVASDNSTYYEEHPLYSEINEALIERCRNTKIKQSPCLVKIHQEFTQNIDLPPLSWHNYDSYSKILNIINTGQTIVINGQWSKCRPYITGGPLNGSYIFSQIHFHSPSEHEINGIRYPLEMHVVHYKTSYLTQEKAMEEKDGTIVIVYLFQVLNSNESILSCIMNSIHLIEGVNDRTELTDVALNQILLPFVSNYYIYWSSVSTSKKCYSLQWIISCTNLSVTQREVERLKKMLCSDESFVESQASQMNVINNVIYHVEDYDLTLEEENNSNCSSFTPKCYCRDHCHCSKICTIHKEIYLQCQTDESNCCAFKGFDRKHIKVQTSSCEKIFKSSSCDDNIRKQKGIENNVEAQCGCLSGNTISQSCICNSKKKCKNKMVAHEVQMCSDVAKTCDDDCQNSVESEILSSCPVIEKCSKSDVCAKATTPLKKKHQKCKQKPEKKPKKVHISETSSCDTSKSSIKAHEKKKIAKSTSEKKKLEFCEKNNSKKMKAKKKQEKTESPPFSCENVKKGKTQIEDKKCNDIRHDNCNENCNKDCNKNYNDEVEIQCMPVLITTDKIKEKLPEKKNSFSEESKKEKKVADSKEEIKKLAMISQKLLKEDKNEKTSICEETIDDVQTIFEKKRGFNNSKTNGNDCTINFLLAPNILQNLCSPVTSESGVGIANRTTLNHNSPADESTRRDIYFQTEHLFRTERNEDSLPHIIQEYNVSIICNQNVIQEFGGSFRPNDLEPGTYEKLQLFPKYPDSEDIGIHLSDCFVKKETSDQLYIRAKFLLNQVNVNNNETKVESKFEEKIKIPNLEFSDVKSNQIDSAEEEKLQQDNEIETQINSNESDLKNEVMKNEESGLLKADSDLKQSSNNITFDSLKRICGEFTELKKEEEEEKREENILIEKTDKAIKDLFYKPKKVYFTCEKIEKDQNSGKEVFIGSFRTKKELKDLLKVNNLNQKTDSSTAHKISVETDKEKNLFLSSSEESLDELVKTKSSKAQQEQKLQSPAKCRKPDNLDESKELITLHKHKPKNSQVNYSKDVQRDIEFQDQEIKIVLDK